MGSCEQGQRWSGRWCRVSRPSRAAEFVASVSALDGGIGNENGSAQETPELKTLKSVTEVEAVRVFIERNVMQRIINVRAAMPAPSKYRDIFITDEVAESSDKGALVQLVIEQVRRGARSMRADVVVEMFDRGIECETDEHVKRIATSIAKHADKATCERLALELMTHVERIGR
jgi:hypothetical protein